MVDARAYVRLRPCAQLAYLPRAHACTHPECHCQDPMKMPLWVWMQRRRMHSGGCKPHLTKVVEPLLRHVRKLRVLLVLFDLNKLQHQRPARDDARASGQEVPAHDSLEH